MPPPRETKVTIDTTGMENSFRNLGDSLNRMFSEQYILNRNMQDHMVTGMTTQVEQTVALQQLAEATQQREYDRLFNSILIYNGEDPAICG